MGKPLFFSALILLKLFATFSFSQTASNFSTDEEALLAFKSRITSDPSHTLSTNWSISTTPICRWFGVSCNAKQRITALNLTNLNLGGTIAPHIGNLTFLTCFDLSRNRLTGPLPDQLSGLGRLNEINLDYNNFTGDIPPWLCTLPNLQFIFMQNNSFSGFIPNFSNLSKVEMFDISYNSIHGNIPKEIGNLSMIKSLDFKYNQLTGSIPSSIFNLSALETLDLTSNIVSGLLPTHMCDNNLATLVGLFLSNNQLSGPIPSSLYKCRRLQRLSLSFNKFNGRIPAQLGELTMLKNLYLGANTFEGGIPPEIGNLSSLEILSIRKSLLTGKTPSFIFNMSSLKEIDLAYNSLSGILPLETHNLPNLEQVFLQSNRLTGESLSFFLGCNKLWLLQLSKNQLTGFVPKAIGNMTQLKILFIHENTMRGEIPYEIGNLNLERLSLANNNFTGSIPISIFNISTMIELELSSNRFTGKLPTTTSPSMSNLEALFLRNNSLAGPIPSYITNASKLSILELSSNSFTGLIPDFSHLRLLQRLLFAQNNLTGVEYPNQELRFLSSLQNCQHLEILEMSLNKLNGILPPSIGNLSTSLRIFRVFSCNIHGSIPAGFGNLTGLESVDFDSNELTGILPTEIGKLRRIEVMYIEHNKLEGRIPETLCQISRLGDLYLSNNMLNGTIPPCIGKLKTLKRVFLDSNRLTSFVPNLWNLTDLWALNLSNNLLTGPIPSNINNLKALRNLDLSWNQFSGNIPSSIGDTESLETLSLAHNGLQGSIPQSLANLRGLESLDLSSNNLSGSIPKSLEALRDLRFFNVSYNRLEGEIPTGGCFANFTAQSFVQNRALCGSVARYQVVECEVTKHVNASIKYYIIVPIVLAVFAVAIVTLWLIRRRKTNKKQVSEMSTPLSWRRVSHQELVQATEDFNGVNLLGSGSFGTVYKATLSDGLKVAVKVFNLDLEDAMKSFDVECEVLSSVRHRNLVKVISCCSSVDFKALVLEYMPNGSLEKWLYSHNYCLDLQQRLNIAIDVALALEYLHHGNVNPIVHCDLKPSNVLLDEDMTARVGDFGISKLFGEEQVLHQTITLATIGYMAPEYGSEGKVSTKGDVYSYGIMLLEMFTRKKPTDDMFSEEMSLKEWVSEALQENAMSEIVGPGLVEGQDRHFRAKEQCVSSIFKVAMRCLAVSSEERLDIIETVIALKKISAALSANVTGRRHVVTTSRREREVALDG